MADPVNELINDWLDTNIVASYVGSVNDKWRVFLKQEGYTFTTLPETQYEYFGDEGYDGFTFTDRYREWIETVIYA